MSDFEKIVAAENRRTLCWLLVGVLALIGVVIARAQPLPVAPAIGTNASVELQIGSISWRRSTNVKAFSYDWGFTNAGTNMGGNTTLTNATVWFALGTNYFWVRSRSTNGETSLPAALTASAYFTSVVHVLPGYDARAKRYATSSWSAWTVSTNTVFAPTNAQMEFRVRLRHTNFWGLQ